MDKKKKQYQFCVAPMLRYTDESCRVLYRKFTKKSVLFTEMILFNQLINKHHYILPYNKENHDPVIVQLAGNNSLDLSKCSKIIYDKNYKEINLNIGCPSKSSEKGNFGIYLMKNINTVLDLIKSIEDSVSIKISIKTRIGIENNNEYAFLKNFIYEITEKTSCKIFFIHARIAILNGFSPKNNRTIPPLKYDYVYKIKKDFPNTTIIINGEINSIKKSIQHLKKVDGVMIGRMIYKNPLLLNNIDNIIYKKKQKKKK
ncbi:tRNA dihydrouridine(20/20a) synthase DusA [Buchnera aphidicola (Kurisakia onigurumii)]|uniref:tRNA dihydrouridine(20/20a) synthase DusA n=1 Tax=Buchnera aphidicola TaxID=9 RepID=UPI0031B6851E